MERPVTGEWVSPLLGIRFDTTVHPMVIYKPDGGPFETFDEVVSGRGKAVRERDAIAEQRDAIAEQRDAIAEQRDAALRDRDRLLARLKELGIEP